MRDTEHIALNESYDKQSAFTLVEISLVLVILGLLVGGIIIAQDMIKQAELRSLVTQVNKYRAAVNTFQLKYGGKPGDLPNAFNFFGPTCNAPAGSAAAGMGAFAWCNGNNNGVMADNASIGLLAWRHLSASGLISESLVGGGGTGFDYDNRQINVNVPGGIRHGHFTIASNTVRALTGNFLVFQAPDLTTNTSTAWEIMSAQEAYGIDVKLDDGQPNTGFVMGLNGQALTGVASPLHSGQFCGPNSFGGDYYKQNTELTCYMYFYIGAY